MGKLSTEFSEDRFNELGSPNLDNAMKASQVTGISLHLLLFMVGCLLFYICKLLKVIWVSSQTHTILLMLTEKGCRYVHDLES